MNVFRVSVNENCRRGKRLLTDFVVSTESNQNDVYNHYLNQYVGLNVDVVHCTALNLDLPKVEPKAPEPKSTATKILTLHQVKLNNAENDMLKECKAIKQKYECALGNFEYAVRERLKKDFAGLMNCHNSGVSVTIEKDFNIKATIAINGSIDDLVDYMIQKGA